MGEQHSGWARHDGEQQVHGPFVSDMVPPNGVLTTDMPAAKPVYRKRPIKGVAPASPTTDEDHRPGGGAWHDV